MHLTLAGLVACWGRFEASQGSLGLKEASEVKGSRFLVLGIGGVAGLCLVSPMRGVKVRRAAFVWTFRRDGVRSRAVLIRRDGRDWGPSGVKIVCTDLPRTRRTSDFSGIFG